MRFILLLLVFLFPVTTDAQSKLFSVDMAEDHIDITVGFNGASMQVFGYRGDIDTSVAIVLSGPKKNITMWKKERVLWAWVNRHSASFLNTPSYYNVALGGNEQITAEDLHRLGIGNHAVLKQTVDPTQTFLKNALLDKKKRKGLFFDKKNDIKFIQDQFFRASFDIPSSASVGEYTITSFLIKDNDIIQKHIATFSVQQVGLNAFINNAAKEHSIIYALFCISLALFSGWFVGILKIR